MKLSSPLFSPNLELKKIGTTSGASRNSTKFVNPFPLAWKHKKLLLNKKWSAGRGSSGRIVVWTKRTQSVKTRYPFINYSFRYIGVSFIAGFIILPKVNKLLSLLFTSSGAASYLPASTNHEMFKLTQFTSVFSERKIFRKNATSFYPLSVLKQSFFIIRQLPKNKPISLIESLPGKGVQYARSTGTFATALKMDSRVSTALIKLPSGVKKVFSTFSIGSLGKVAVPENRKSANASAGFYKNHGKKSKVRGVAMNPIDHPHGGRAKAIRYQRTPWGKTTKFK